MKVEVTIRNFEIINHPMYGGGEDHGKPLRLVQQSSAVGLTEDGEGLRHPGSSFLWIGEHHHLNREEVSELARRLQLWVETGMLSEEHERTEEDQE